MSNKINKLRNKAEKGLKPEGIAADEVSKLDAGKPARELRDHQVRPEIQNGECRASRRELEKSRDKYSGLYDFAPVGYVTMDTNGLIIDANHTAAEQLGTGTGSLIKMLLAHFIHMDDQDAFYLHRQDVIRGKTRRACELRMTRTDKSEFNALLVSIAVPGCSGSIELIRSAISNITKQKDTEKRLQIMNKAIESSISAIAFADLEGTLTYVNPSFLKLWGYTDAKEVLGRHAATFWQSEEKADHVINMLRSKESWNGEMIARRQDGTSFDVQLTSSIVRDDGGNPFCMMGSFIDITERKKIEKEQSELHGRLEAQWEIARIAEEELRRHREQLMELVEDRTKELQKIAEELEDEVAERTRAEAQAKLMALFAELSPSPVIRFDGEGKVLMANPAAVKIFRLDPLTGRHFTSFIPGTEKLDISACVSNGLILSHTAQIRDRYYHFTFKGLPDLGMGQIYGSDITDQRNAEEETIRAGQLAALGELSAGVAHEINNPINGIVNYAQMLIDKTEQGSMMNDIAHQIIEEGDRIVKIVSNLLSFARYEENEMRPVHISDVVSESLLLMKVQLQKERISWKVDISPGLPAITADFKLLQQVCLNIVNNARYSLNEKHQGSGEDKVLEIHGEKARINNRDFVRLTFFDNGTGIPRELLTRVMNPFFTTKPRSSGTGLGLSICHTIVNNHEGSLKIESAEGEYTKVVLDLPARMENTE